MASDPSRLSANGEIVAARSLGFSRRGWVISEERYCLDKAKCFASEGRRAFLKKRSPKFKGASCKIPVVDIRCFRSLPSLPTVACPAPSCAAFDHGENKARGRVGLILIAIFRNGCAHDGIRFMI